MNREQEDKFFRQALRTLPAHAPSRKFNSRVLAACAAQRKAALPLTAKIMVLISLAWGATAAIGAAVLASIYAREITGFLLNPPALGDMMALGALKLWTTCRFALGLLETAGAALVKGHTLWSIVLATGLAAAAMVEISKDRQVHTH